MPLPSYHPFRSDKLKEQYLAFYDRKARLWPVVSTTRMVETTHGRTFVRISGSPEAPALVLLPGAGSNSLMWIPNIAALSASFRTYAVDHIYDYGRSVYRRLPRQIPDDLVAWLDDLFAALGLGDRFGLIGGSHGGWLAAQYALRFPSRIAKLALMAPAGTVLPVSPEFLLRALFSVLPPRFFKRRLLYWVFSDLARMGEAGRRTVEESADEMQLAARCFRPNPALVNPTVLSDRQLQILPRPTLYIAGEHDKMYSSRKAVKRLRRVAPHIQTEIIPGAGHDFTLVQTDLVNRKLLEFLRQA